VTGRFERDLTLLRKSMQEVDVLLPVVLDPDWRRGLALAVDLDEDRELLVCITAGMEWLLWAQVALS
jgi:hypothetical protein